MEKFDKKDPALIRTTYMAATEYEAATKVLQPHMYTGVKDLYDAHVYIVKPMFSMSAFASELYLKALAMHFGRPVKQEHSLLNLFKLLPEEFQNSIIKLYIKTDERGHITDSERFMQHLEHYANAFVDIRYMHENKRGSFDAMFLVVFAFALRRHCDGLGMDKLKA